MPDLRRRPARYATALVLVTALGAGTWTQLDVRLGPDAALSAARSSAASLASDLQEARAQLAESTSNTPVTTSPTGSASPTGSGGGGTTGDTVFSSGTGTATAVRAVNAVASTRVTSCLTYPDQESAQTAFDRDRTRLSVLDGDGDGRACEQLRSARQAPAVVPREKADPARPATGSEGGKGSAAPTGTPRPTSTPTAVPTSRPSASTATPRCDGYPDRESAQAAFDADPVRLAALDGDRDGRACEQLRSRVTPTVTATPPVRTPAWPTAPTKAEIVSSGRYFGLSTATAQEAVALEGSLRRQSNLTSTYQGWDTDFDPARVVEAWRAGTLPMITWESRPLETPDTGAVNYALRNIAAGAFDDYLTRWARDVRATGLPVAIRFDHEMNGDWYRWSTATGGGASNANTAGNTPAEYVAAWRKVHDVFQAAGANDLVVWVWAPNRVDNISSSRFPAVGTLYPGGSYVDWVGMTGYYRPEDVSSRQPLTFDATYQRTFTQLRLVAPGKPVLIAEVGATETGGNKAAWVTAFFSGLARQDDVVGFVWFQYAVSQNGFTNDWRLDSTAPVFTAFSTGLAASQHGLEVGKSFHLQPVGAVAPTPAPTATAPAPAPTATATATATATPTATTTPTATATSSPPTSSPPTSSPPTSSPPTSTATATPSATATR